ncbi:MAG: biotin--[acetyl-CoA-carboxylase] ligase [Cyanobacteria bacterium P01_A01_bin.105]
MNLDRLHHHLATYPLAVAPTLRGLRPQLKIHYVETLSSTNQTLWDMARQGATSGTVVVAGQQTAGRGQRGKPWVSSPGGIYVSMLLTPDRANTIAPPLTLATGWGIATLLRQWPVPVEIKWPNDLVVRAVANPTQLLKLGGILIETRSAGPRLTQAVVGVGINYRNRLPTGAISLSSLAPPTAARAIPNRSIEFAIATVLMGIWQGICWYQQVGPAKFIPAYEALLAHLGQPIQTGENIGQVIGITQDGGLRVRYLNPMPGPTPRPEIAVLSTEQVSLSYNVAELNRMV